MFATLSKMFGWLVEKRRLSRNPCAGVHRPATQRAKRPAARPRSSRFGAPREPNAKFAAVLKAAAADRAAPGRSPWPAAQRADPRLQDVAHPGSADSRITASTWCRYRNSLGTFWRT